MAIYLAGYLVPGNPKATREMRDRALQILITFIHDLIEPNAKEMGTWQE